MSDPASIHITAEVTPNPNSMRFLVNRVLVEWGTVEYAEREKAAESQIASRLFSLGEVTGVMIGKNFITVTKVPQAEWGPLMNRIQNEIRQGLLAGETAVPPGVKAPPDVSHTREDPVASKVRKILDEEIRPALAMDGGDVRFISYSDGIVTLHLQGACSHCPSATLTLKMGVENRLRAEIPEIREVVEV